MPWQATCAVVETIHGCVQRSTQPPKRGSKSKMGHLKKLTRSSFIVGSVTIAGAVAFGGWKARKNPLRQLKGRCVKPLAHN